jgi:hypothetical protein
VRDQFVVEIDGLERFDKERMAVELAARITPSICGCPAITDEAPLRMVTNSS